MNDPTANLLDPTVQKCPFPFYERLRATAPVAFMPELGAFYISTFELGRKVLLDFTNFAKKTANNDGRRFVTPSKAAQRILIEKDVGTPLNAVSQSNGTQHVAYRGIVDPRFKLSSIRSMEASVTATALALIERFAEFGECEVVDAYAMPLPVYVILDIFGLPRSEFRAFKKFSDAVLTYMALIVPEAEAVAGAETMVQMHHHILKLAQERRRAPTDDLLSVLANAKYEGVRPLTDREICSYIDELLVAGNETTTNTISAGLLYLGQHPETQQALRANPDLIPRFVEELLRVTAPLQIGLRYALNDVNVGGVDIPAGSLVYVGLASANRDGCPFTSGDTIDLQRKNAATHLTFGAGQHHCLGSELARLELRVTFREWLANFSNIDLAQDPDTVRYPASYALRGPLAVNIRYRRRAA
jgi:cytochrome P450